MRGYETMEKIDIWQEYSAAKKAFEEAQRETSQMRSRETDALNRLNQAQKAIRKFMDEQLKNAPRESDWGSELRRKDLKTVEVPFQ
jgi:hypothetical protein